MDILPAIDIIGGQVVRLTYGDYQQKKVYTLSPMEAATAFKNDGAAFLHVVDLDGAKSGSPENLSVIADLGKNSGLFVEVGGGIRSRKQIETYLENGIKRVILGTVAVTDPVFVQEMVKTYGNAIAVGVDARDGWVAVRGWMEKSEVRAVDLCKRLYEEGVSTLIYTDIAKDGALSGVNQKAYEELRSLSNIHLIASGGVSNLNDIQTLKQTKVDGVIIGKALYENRIRLKDALKLAGEETC